MNYEIIENRASATSLSLDKYFILNNKDQLYKFDSKVDEKFFRILNN